MTEVDYQFLISFIGALSLVGVGLVGLLGVEGGRLIQAGLLALSLVAVAVFIFNLGERYGMQKAEADDDISRGS